MTKILFLSPHFSEYSLCLARALVQRAGISVLLVLNKANAEAEIGELSRIPQLPNLKVVLLPHDRSLRCFLVNTWRYLRLNRQFKPDVIHVQEEPKDYMVFALALTMRPVVLTIHDPLPHTGDSTNSAAFSRRALYRHYLRWRAHGAIVHGVRLAENLSDQGFKKPVVVAPHGPLGIFDEQPMADWIDGHCLFFGRMQSYKGLAEFIRAVELVANAHPHVHGVIAGRGPELVRCRSALQDNPRFTVIEKFLLPHEVVHRFQQANVVVLPYREATQSGVAAYALGIGRPLVVTEVGSLPDVVDNGHNGFVVPPKHAQPLAQAISTILADRTTAKLMGKHSLAIGKGRLSWENSAIATIALYERLKF